MSSRSEPAREPRDLDREWWLRTLFVLSTPRSTFAALRDDSPQAAAARSEPMAALLFLGGIAIFLSTRTAGRLFDDVAYDGLVVVVEAIVAGMLVGLQSFWIGGGALYLGARGAGSAGSYRRARHVIGFALAPFVVSLVAVWPVRLAVFGGDVFRSGGSDSGAGGTAFQAIDACFLAWAVGLLVLGMRTVHGWSWARTLGGLSLAAVVFVAVAVAFVVL